MIITEYITEKSDFTFIIKTSFFFDCANRLRCHPFILQLDIKYNVVLQRSLQHKGPKWCGETTTTKQKAVSIIKLQDTDKRDEYLATALNRTSRIADLLIVITGGEYVYTRLDGVHAIAIACLKS